MAMGLCVVPSDSYELTYTGGALALGSTLFWAMGMAGNLTARRAMRGEDVAADLDEFTAAVNDFPTLYRTTPLTDIPILDKHFPSWRKWLEHPARDEWWQARAVPRRDDIPTVVVAGWHDLFLNGSLQQFAEAAPYAGSRLVIGPWGHGMPGTALEDVDYGRASSGMAVGLDAEMLDFLASHVRGESSDSKPARASGCSAWGEPLAGRAQLAADRHHSDRPVPLRRRKIVCRRGDRRSPRPLSCSTPGTRAHDGRTPLVADGDAANARGSCDQRPLDLRQDVLRFTTEPLATNMDVIGPVIVTLFAAASAADTDWTAKLVDVWPDGRALNIVDGIVRARYRNPSCGEELLEPNRPHEFVIELGATAQRVTASGSISPARTFPASTAILARGLSRRHR
ncbi:hypothetical protein AU252_10075 [Pseudarthrobacter sulfonivorans]|uniref:Xaa-Pro dipeptidyl-peptidase C-terminal domain-containing protein n=1 Tax=Pseudarthrobacter sulfonivorans TaxID=121292 RepID=A0A0U3QAQ8_9MICC|nr:hypothetical protein AU252_10075 [Pseudarthrobacter sulfonivorans]